MADFTLQYQVLNNTAKLNIFTLWLFTEKADPMLNNNIQETRGLHVPVFFPLMHMKINI